LGSAGFGILYDTSDALWIVACWNVETASSVPQRPPKSNASWPIESKIASPSAGRLSAFSAQGDAKKKEAANASCIRRLMPIFVFDEPVG
jgi:hypothetical protein